MPGHFKKRRAKTINKNEEKVRRGERAEGQARLAGAVGSRFPGVKRLNLKIVFLDAHQVQLDEKTMALEANAAAVLTLSCPGRCGRGTLDVRPKIADAAATRQPLVEVRIPCPEPLFAGSAEKCGCEARCRIELEYFPAEEPA